MAQVTIGHNFPKTYQTGTHSIIKDGNVINGVPDETVYVSSDSELSKYAEKPAGTVAIQYGFKAMWQKQPDGTWLKM